jgi:hypothetical protein
MARMVGYQCVKCGYDEEELFNDSEEKPEFLNRICTQDVSDPDTGETLICGGQLKKRDIKNNCHRWNYNDRGGL